MQYIIFTQENLSAMYWIVFHLDMRGYSVQYEHPFISHQRVARKPIWYEMIQFQDRRGAACSLLPPQSPRGFSALARLYYLATKTAMLRRLCSLMLRHRNESN